MDECVVVILLALNYSSDVIRRQTNCSDYGGDGRERGRVKSGSKPIATDSLLALNEWREAIPAQQDTMEL